MADDSSAAGASAPRDAGTPLADETRQRILESARRLVHRDGLPALTVGNVAAEAGVYKAAVSYHFGGKAGLMASLVTSYFDEIDARIAAAVRTCPPGWPRVRFIAKNWLDFVAPENDLIFFDVLGYVLRKKELRGQLQDFYQRWTDLILRLVTEDSDIDESSGRDLAALLRMLLDGMAVERLINPERDDWRRAGLVLAKMTSLGEDDRVKLDQITP